MAAGPTSYLLVIARAPTRPRLSSSARSLGGNCTDDLHHHLTTLLLGHDLSVVAPGVEDHLAVAVEGEVEHYGAPPRHHELPQGRGLRLAEGPGAPELLAAGLAAAAAAAPLVAEVSVEIDPSTPPSLRVRSVLTRKLQLLTRNQT